MSYNFIQRSVCHENVITHKNIIKSSTTASVDLHRRKKILSIYMYMYEVSMKYHPDTTKIVASKI